MQDGSLLWFDADKKRDLADKIARAADRYRVKFGQAANICYINIDQLDGLEGQTVKGVRVLGAENVSINYFRVGVEGAT